MDEIKIQYVYSNGDEPHENDVEYVVEADPEQETEDMHSKMEEEPHQISEERAHELEHDDNNPDCRRRDSHHCWGIQQSKVLIETMKLFKEELGSSKNRREVWEKIHQDVSNKGLKVSVAECQNKWKNLVRSYKECSKMRNKSNMRFRYFKEMGEYFGPEKFISMDHDYNKSKLTLMPLLSTGNSSTSNAVPTVTFPPICFTDRQFIEYTNMKREEYSARQKRHEQEMALRKQELDVQKKKLEVMKKTAIANLPTNKNVNFDFPCRWPDEATNMLISIIRRRKYEIADRDQTKKPALWNEIMQEMVDNGFQISVKEVKSKWRNLIRTYNLRCKNQRQKGFKFKFFQEMQDFYRETESLGIDSVVFEVFSGN